MVTNFSGWADNLVPEVNATVESYYGSILVKAFAGVEGYDLQVNHDGSGNVTELINLVDGEVYQSGTSGYVYLYTGLDYYYCFAPYLSLGYCYVYGEDSSYTSYLILCAYFTNEDGEQEYGAYYVEWSGRVSGISAIETESAADAVYYNLQGVRVENPTAGKVYIRVANGQATKVVK